MFDFCDIEITRDGDNRSAPCLFVPNPSIPVFYGWGSRGHHAEAGASGATAAPRTIRPAAAVRARASPRTAPPVLPLRKAKQGWEKRRGLTNLPCLSTHMLDSTLIDST